MKNLTGLFKTIREISQISQISFIMGIFMLFPGINTSMADNIITAGTTLKIASGTSLVSTGGITIKNGATLDNSGSLVLKGNLTNENAAPNSLGTGLVELSGTTNQVITGMNTIGDLTLNNTAGATNSGETEVTGILTLTAGTIALGSNNLLLGPLATVAGTPSSATMVVATGSGQLRKEFPSGFAGSFTFPVGDATGVAQYSPVTLIFTSGVFPSENYAGISLANEKYPDPVITGNYLDRYWTITQSGIGDFTCDAVFQYLASDVNGTENLISCTKVNPLPWTTYALADAALHQLTAIGIGSFSVFTGVKSTTPPANQELANITIPDGIANCYDATQALTVAGNGTTFIVEPNGSVTLVAGERISILPGATVLYGGYLHADITTTGTYCGSSMNPLVTNLVNEEKELTTFVEEPTNRWFKIYPNPATDYVVVEFDPLSAPSLTRVAIYNVNGKPILQQTLYNENNHRFSLTAQPVGIYVVKVVAGNRVEIAKIVKK